MRVFLDGVFTSTSVRTVEPFLTALFDANVGPRTAQPLKAFISELTKSVDLAPLLSSDQLQANEALGKRTG